MPVIVLLAACGGGGGGAGSATSSSNTTTTAAAAPTYSIGGSISGLTSQGLILVNGTDAIAPNAGDTSFTFVTDLAAGASYSVSVQLQPDATHCTVAGGNGVVGGANVTDIAVTCAAAAFTVGGTISGLTGNGLVLANGSDMTSPAPGAATFTFPTKVAAATSYNVTVSSQPMGQTCTVSNGTGVILTSSVNNVAISC